MVRPVDNSLGNCVMNITCDTPMKPLTFESIYVIIPLYK